MEDFNELNTLSKPETSRKSTGRIVGFTILALVLGLLTPFTAPITLLLWMPTVWLTALLAVAFERAAGRVPAFTLLGVSVLALALSSFAEAGLFALVVVPVALVAMFGVRARKPFEEQMRRAIPVAVGCVFLAVLLTVLIYGRDLIGRIAEQLNPLYMAEFERAWPLYSDLFTRLGMPITLEAFKQYMTEILVNIEVYYQQNLLGNLLTGSVLTAILAVFWGNWLSARRGEATPESFKGLHEWYLPANLTYGLLIMLCASVLLGLTSMYGAEKTAITVRGLCMTAFIIQGLGAWDRRMKQAGRSRRYRTAWVIIFLIGGLIVEAMIGVSAYAVMALIGVWSALFGRKGALRGKIDSMKKQE